MHGLTVRLSRTVLPRWLNSQPSSTFTRAVLSCSPSESSILRTLAVCGEEGPIDRATGAVTHVLGHNWTATVDGPRESVLEAGGNAQPEYPLWGILVARLRLAGNQNAARSGDAL